jgi:acyl-coenzyme A thioesterase PaaI-like protein
MCSFDLPAKAIQPRETAYLDYLAAVADEMVGMAAMTVLDGLGFSNSDLRLQFFRSLKDAKVFIEAVVENQS